MTALDYKEISLKLKKDGPAIPWDFFNSTIVKELENSEIKYTQKATSLFGNDFKSCLHLLPKDEKDLKYWFRSDSGIWVVIITENFICSIKCIYYSVNKDTDEIGTYLYYEDANNTINKKYQDFDVACIEADSLIRDQYDLFDKLAQAYLKVKEYINFYFDHVSILTPEINGVYMWQLQVDGNLIYEQPVGQFSSDKNYWKI